MVWYGITRNVLYNLPRLSNTRTLISSDLEVSTSSLKSLTVGFGKIFTSMRSTVAVGVVVPPFTVVLVVFVPLLFPANPGGGQAGSFTCVTLVEALVPQPFT